MARLPALSPLSVLVILLALVGLAGCATTPAPDPAGETVPVGQRIYEVFGMDCPGCHGGLENLVLAVPGVKSATASWERSTLTLEVAEGVEVPDQAVHQAIRDANFTPGERLQ